MPGPLRSSEVSVIRPLKLRVVLTWVSLLVASIVFLMIGLEVSLRLIHHHDDYMIWPPNIEHTFQPSSEILSGVSGPAHFTTNAHGFRGRPLSEHDPHRILAVGGSTTENLYLDDHEAWPALLEDIAAGHGIRGVWVANAGRAGRNTRHHVVQVYHILNSGLAIDCIIVLAGVNDFTFRLRQGEFYQARDLAWIMSDEDVLRLSFAVVPTDATALPFYRRTETWIALRNLHFLFGSRSRLQNTEGEQIRRWRQGRNNARYIENRLPDLTEALSEYRRNLIYIVELAEQKGIKLFFATQPSLWHRELTKEEQNLLWLGAGERGFYYSVGALSAGMSRYNEIMREVCRDHTKVDCIDLDRRISKATSMFYDDVHFTEAGSRRVATIVGQHVIRWLSSTGKD